MSPGWQNFNGPIWCELLVSMSLFTSIQPCFFNLKKRYVRAHMHAPTHTIFLPEPRLLSFSLGSQPQIFITCFLRTHSYLLGLSEHLNIFKENKKDERFCGYWIFKDERWLIGGQSQVSFHSEESFASFKKLFNLSQIKFVSGIKLKTISTTEDSGTN